MNKKLIYRDELGRFELWEETSVLNFEAVPLSENYDEEAKELVDVINNSRGEEVTTQVARTPDGHYIGNEERALYLCVEKGIRPELMSEDSEVCSIGFCWKEEKWYGWSHRAIYGFGIGDTVEEGDCCSLSGWTEEYLKDHPEADKSLPVGFQAKSLDDAKRMAIAFAERVS